MEKTKSFVAGLLAAAASVLPGMALAQEVGLRDAMRARMQARIEGPQRGEPRPTGGQGDRAQVDRAQVDRAADNGAWQRRERAEPQQRGEWHRADRPTRGNDSPADRGERDPDRRQGERGRPDGRGDDGRVRPDRPANTDQSQIQRGGRSRAERDNRGPENARAGDRRGRDWQGRDWCGREGASWRYEQARDERAWYDRSDFDERRDWNWRSGDARRSIRAGGGWDRSWRQSGRYNWNGDRASNRAAYHLPRYYAPHEWSGGYRRFSPGARLSSPLFAERYWIEDVYAYRLPEAYGPYRWVRFYNDALLVDVEAGDVVDAVNDIFW